MRQLPTTSWFDIPAPRAPRKRVSFALSASSAVAAVVCAAAGIGVGLAAPAGAAVAQRAPSGANVAVVSVAPSRHGCVVGEHVAFRPPTVIEQRTTTLVVMLHNCTTASATVELTQFGLFVCMALDPFAQQVTIPAGRSIAVRTRYLAPSCAGTGHVTARVSTTSGQDLVSRTALLTIMAPPPYSGSA
jgi:hypothetical protein